MILAAEKSGLQAELIFYKNELAKMCLSSGATFPIFRQSDLVSSKATSQILAKNSTSNSYLPTTSLFNPQSFYPSSKQHSIICLSQQHENEDNVSTVMSNMAKVPHLAATENDNNEDASTVKRGESYENLPQKLEIESKKDFNT